MLTVKQLLSLTPSKVRRRATEEWIKVQTNRKQKRFGKEFRSIYAWVRLLNNESSHDHYQVVVENHGSRKNPADLKLTQDSQVWVHCDCPYFTYYLEWVLTSKGSSSIRNALNQPPGPKSNKRSKNPERRPYVCKHLFALMLFLLAKYKDKDEK